jgi:hypothetical protein
MRHSRYEILFVGKTKPFEMTLSGGVELSSASDGICG